MSSSLAETPPGDEGDSRPPAGVDARLADLRPELFGCTRLGRRAGALTSLAAPPLVHQHEQNQTRSLETAGFVGDTLQDAFDNVCATYGKTEMTKEIYKKVLSETELYVGRRGLY